MIAHKTAKEPKKPRRNVPKTTWMQIHQLLESAPDTPLPELSAMFGIDERTIYGHLYKYQSKETKERRRFNSLSSKAECDSLSLTNDAHTHVSAHVKARYGLALIEALDAIRALKPTTMKEAALKVESLQKLSLIKSQFYPDGLEHDLAVKGAGASHNQAVTVNVQVRPPMRVSREKIVEIE